MAVRLPRSLIGLEVKVAGHDRWGRVQETQSVGKGRNLQLVEAVVRIKDTTVRIKPDQIEKTRKAR